MFTDRAKKAVSTDGTLRTAIPTQNLHIPIAPSATPASGSSSPPLLPPPAGDHSFQVIKSGRSASAKGGKPTIQKTLSSSSIRNPGVDYVDQRTSSACSSQNGEQFPTNGSARSSAYFADNGPGSARSSSTFAPRGAFLTATDLLVADRQSGSEDSVDGMLASGASRCTILVTLVMHIFTLVLHIVTLVIRFILSVIHFVQGCSPAECSQCNCTSLHWYYTA
jgi:hypothetical protein